MDTETLPPPTDTQPPVAPETVAPPATTEPDAPPPFDFFDAELAELKAEAEREQTGAPAPTATEGVPAGGQPAPAAATPPPQAAPPIMVPIERLNEAVGKGRAYQDQVAYLQGQIDALTRGQPSTDPGTAQPDQPAQTTAPTTLEQQIEHLTQRRLASAEKYDRGDITFLDHQKEAASIDADVLRIAAAAAQPAQRQMSGPQMVEELAVEQVQREFEAFSPWGYVYNDKQFAVVLGKADVSLEARGWTPQMPGYAAERLKVAAYFAEKDGPDTFGITYEQADAYARQHAVAGVYKGRRAPAAGGSPAGGPAPTAKPMSPQAQARAGKLDLAARMPPDFSGATTTPAAPLSEADINNMTDDQVAALPKEVRLRVLQQIY